MGGQAYGFFQARREGGDPLLEIGEKRQPVFTSLLPRRRRRGVQRDQMVDRRAGRRLSALVQPEAGEHGGIIGAPDPRNEFRLGGRRHGAGRCAEDIGELARGVGRRAAGAAPADRAQPAGMRIDQRGADRRAGAKPQFSRRRDGEARSDRCARLDHLGADSRKALVGQDAEADLPEEAFVEALLMREIGPFARQRAGRALQTAGRPECQPVGEIEEMRCGAEALGHRLGKPQQLRRLHLGRDRSADIGEHAVAGRIDAPGLVDRAVIHPYDDVAVRVARGANRDGRAVGRDGDEGAGRVEAEPRDGFRLDRGCGHGLAHRCADRPSICRRRIARPRRRARARSRSAAWRRRQAAPYRRISRLWRSRFQHRCR